MKQRYFRSLSLGLLAALTALACILTACPTGGDDTPEAKTYTVTFNVDGGSAVPDQKVEEGKTFTKPANPTKAGHTFANWYKDSNKTTLWNFDTDVVVQDTTIYAKWVSGENVESFKVTFDVDGGAPAPAEQSVLKDEKVAQPARPTKAGYIFVGWFNGDTQWDFATGTVTADITLKAKWTPAVTVTFESNGGSAIAPVTVAKGDEVYLSSYRPSKDGHVFDGWYKDEAFKTPAASELTVSTDIKLYAKWTSTSALAPYVGVWRGEYTSFLLQDDGTAWEFYSDGEFGKSTWSTSQIDGETVSFNTEKTSFTMYGSTYTKNTTETKTPAAATGALLGTWTSGSGSQTVELKADKTAEITSYSDTITLNYCAETDAVYLLKPTDNLVISSIAIEGGKLRGLSKSTSDAALAGIWKLTEGEQDYYWTLKVDGSGTFHTLGAKMTVSFTVTEDKEIDGDSYTVSGDGNTLTLPGAKWDEENSQSVDVVLTKVDSVPAGTGADGDSRLHGSWSITQGEATLTLTFNSDGVAVQNQNGQSYSVIWKADGTTLYLYYPNISSSRGYGMSYTVSGSTLTLGDMVLTK